jgi:hypothetical protein
VCTHVLLGGQLPITDPHSGDRLPTTFSKPMSGDVGRGTRRGRSTTTLGQGDARLPQHSVTPCLVSGVRNKASGRETAAQSADWPDLCVPLRQSPAGAVRTTQVLALVSGPQFQPEILRRVTGSEDPGTNLPYPGPGRVCRTTSYGHARQALMSTAMTGPGGGSRRYCSYFAASSESARLYSAPGPMMRAMPSTRIHHSADQSSM